jgi:hypothetical protein
MKIPDSLLAEIFSMRKSLTIFVTAVSIAIFLPSLSWSQSPAAQNPASQAPSAQPPAPAYQAKFPGDPAHSDSEADALGYLRVAMRAEHLFNKHYGHYAESLRELVHTGSFTNRMVNPSQGDYSVSFKGKKDGFAITMTPNQIDAAHRSFYGNEDGKIHADEEKPADEKSPVISKAFRADSK